MTPSCKCCGGPTARFGSVDRARSCADRNGTVFAPTGESVTYWACRRCGFVFTTDFDGLSEAELGQAIYNADCALVDPDFAEALLAPRFGHVSLHSHACLQERLCQVGVRHIALKNRLHVFHAVQPHAAARLLLREGAGYSLYLASLLGLARLGSWLGRRRLRTARKPHPTCATPAARSRSTSAWPRSPKWPGSDAQARWQLDRNERPTDKLFRAVCLSAPARKSP